jgi:single-strand DNA-binding protein
MNKVVLHGNVGKDPEVKLVGEKKVAKFSLATQSFRKDKDGKRISDWHNLIFWDKLAELCEKYIKKGSELIVEGEISYRDYTDKEGVKKYFTEIVCHSLEFCGKKEAETGPVAKDEYQGGSANKEAIVNKAKENEDELSDLPFVLTIPIALSLFMQLI